MPTSSAPLKPVTQSELVRAALVVVATLVGLQLLWAARFLVLTAFLGVLFGLAAGQATSWICAKIRVTRSVIAPLVVFGTVAFVLLLGAWSAPTLVSQSQELRIKLPEAITKLEVWLATNQPKLLDAIAPVDAKGEPATAGEAVPSDAPQTRRDSTATRAEAKGRLAGALAQHGPSLTGFAFGVLQSTLAVFAAVILVIFLAVYIASDPDVYRRGLLLLVPHRRRDRVGELLTALGAALRTWFATQLIAMVVIGLVTTVALALIGVRGAFPLGVIAGIFEFIPNIGPTLSAVPAILMGFADSPRMALIVVGLYWVIQFLENNLLIPYLMKEQLDLPPALTLVTQVIMAYVFGFLGLFVAIPLLATVVVAVRMLWIDEDIPPFPTTAEHRAMRLAAAAAPQPAAGPESKP